MLLASARLVGLGPFQDTTLSFVDADDDVVTPRLANVLFGGAGTGKTLLFATLAQTRPGNAMPPLMAGRLATVTASDVPGPAARCAWFLGRDAPGRPHPLVVTGPTALLDGETPEAAVTRRREQALFDKRAQTEGGFVFVAFSGARWFSRTPNILTTPDKTILRWDPRHVASFDDPARADLARETKQVLAFADVAQALARGRADVAHLGRLDAAVREVLDVLLAPFDVSYVGVSPTTLEPELRNARGDVLPFDALPRAAKHLTAIGILGLRALYAAYPGEEEPRQAEGVICVDDIDAQQDPSIHEHLVPLLRAALPGVQWLLSTSSTQLMMACEAATVIALRAGEAGIEPGDGVFH